MINNMPVTDINILKYMKYLLYVNLCLSILFFYFSCAGRETIESYLPILGHWKTEKGIIMSIYKTPNKGVAATIKNARGFAGEEVQQGKAVISHIEPLVDGGYRGMFEMPGKLKSMEVRLVLSSRNTLLIITRDKRAKSKIMKWQRVRKSP